MNSKLWVTFVTAAAAGASLVGLLIFWSDGDSFMTALAGMLCGWWLGVILAPYSGESEKFEKWSKGLFGLVSGVTLTKIYDFFEGLSEPQKQALWNELILRRAAFGLCSFLLTALVVFVARSYADG